MDGCGSPVDAVKTDEEIDIEVSKVEVDVNQVETNEEVNEDFLLLFGYMFQKCLGSDAWGTVNDSLFLEDGVISFNGEVRRVAVRGVP